MARVPVPRDSLAVGARMTVRECGPDIGPGRRVSDCARRNSRRRSRFRVQPSFGNLGQDLTSSRGGYTIDFRTMTFRLGAGDR